MDIIGMSEFPLLLGIFLLAPVGFLGLITGAVNAIGSIFGGGKSKTSSSAADFSSQLNAFKKEMSNQMAVQAQESKKNLMVVGIGAVVIIIFIFLFMRK